MKTSELKLNDKDRLLLKLTALGMEDRLIAIALETSTQGAKNRSRMIRAKLSVRNRVQLAMMAVKLGLVPHFRYEKGADEKTIGNS